MKRAVDARRLIKTAFVASGGCRTRMPGAAQQKEVSGQLLVATENTGPKSVVAPALPSCRRARWRLGIAGERFSARPGRRLQLG